MNWFKRTFGSKKQEATRIPGYPDTRIPGTGRSRRLTSYLLPLTTALATGFLMIHTATVVSAPTNFTSGPPYGQTDWTVENAAATSTLPINPATYTTYTLKTAGLVAGTDIQLQSSSYTALQTSQDGSADTPAGGSGFNAGTKTNTVVFGTGASASVKLGPPVFDNGTGADGAINLASACTGTGISGTHPNCDLAGATYNYTTVDIPNGVTVNVTGTTPLVIKATGNVTIAGTINLNGGNGVGGTGGIGIAGGGNGGSGGLYAGANGGVGGGIGGGGGGTTGAIFGAGGGGGGYGTAGTAGTNGSGAAGAAGCVYSGLSCGGTDATLNSLLGGSGGGGGGGKTGWWDAMAGGAGGGALKITSTGTITVSGTISANGGTAGYCSACGNASSASGGGGGGSGGSIFLQANTVNISGVVSALGGAGGSGGGTTGKAGGAGANGRIRVDYATSLSGTTNPTAYTALYTPSGTFESATIDLGANTYNLDTLSWNATVPSAANGGGMTIPTTTTGLLNLWEMENVLTDAKGSNTLTNSAAAFDSVTKKLGSYSLSFDAPADKVNTGSPIASMSTFSIEGWVKFATASQATGDGYIFDIFSDPSVVRNTSNKIIVNRDGALGITSNATLNDTNWHHIAITADGTNLKLYIDGAYDNQVAWAGTSTAAALYLGDNNGVEYFTGNIDEVAVYNRALTADEIAARYASLKFQIAAKTTDSFVAGDYVGPDGTANTYFTQPVGLWHLNEVTSNQTPDASGSGNTGTLGATTAVEASDPALDTTNKKLGAGALTFDGVDDYVSIGETGLNAANITVEAWVNPSATQAARIFIIKYGEAGAVPHGWGLGISDSTANVVKWFTSTDAGVNNTIYSTTVLSNNVWYHIVGTFDGTTKRLYINGVEESSVTWSNSIGYTSTISSIGNIRNFGVQFFNGRIDEVAVYDRALTQAEITARYNAGAGREGWAIPSGLNTPLKQYVRYKAYLSTADVSATPQLNDLTISYSGYPALASLTSSKFDTGAANSFIKSITWSEPVAATAAKDIKFQISAADLSTNLGTFCGPNDGTAGTCTGGTTSYFMDPTGSEAVDDIQIPGRWFQYKAFLTSDGTGTATLDNINVTYDTAYFKLTATDGTTTSGSTSAGTGYPIKITVLDSAGNLLDGIGGRPNFSGSKTLTFTGASTIGGNVPRVSDNATCDGGDPTFSAVPITFSAGVADPPGGGTDYYLCAYKAETVPISASYNGIPSTAPGGSFSLTVNGTTTVTSFSLNAPADITAGGARAAYTLTRLDQYGNPTLGSGSQVVYLYTTSAGANAKFDDAATGTTYITSITIPNGQSSVNFWYYDELAGSFTITASDNSISPDGATGVIDATDALGVNPEVASLFTVNAPADILAGTRAAYTVTRYDLFNNLVTNGAQTVYLYSNSAGVGKAFYNVAVAGTPVTSVSIANTASAANFWYYDELTGSFTITASDATPSADALVGIDDATDTLGVTPAAASKGVFTTQPSATVLAGANLAQQPVVQIQDAFGNVRSADSSLNPVTLSAVWSSDGTTAGGGILSATANPKNEVDGVAAFAGINYTKAESIKLKAVSGALTPALSNAITVSPAAAASFVVAGITDPVAAGTASDVTVTAKDAYNNTVTGYLGAIAFTSNDAQAVLPANYTFLAGDLGVKTFTSGVTMKTSGERTVTVTDVAGDSFGVDGITGNQSAITVNSSAAVNFAVSGISDPVVAGTASNVTVTAKDTYGNTVTGYTGAVTFTSTDAQAVLPANYTFLAGDLGVKTFTNGVTMKTAGERTVTVTDVAGDSLGVDGITGNQPAITVNPAAAASFTVGGITDPVVAGTASNATVTVKDTYGNTVTGYLGAIAFTSNDAQAVLPANYTFIGGDNGVHTFTNGVTMKTAGERTVTVTDVTGDSLGVDGITGNQPAITVNVGAVSAAISTISAASPVNTGANSTITVTAKDAYGNVLSGIAAANVVLASTGSENTITQPSVATDANGQATGTISSTYPQAKTVSVTINGTAITSTATVNVNGIKITAPTSSNTWGAGFANNIQWITYGMTPPFTVQYTTDGTNWFTVRDSANNLAVNVTGASPYTQEWKIPSNLTINTNQTQIKVFETNNASNFKISSNFSISGGLTIEQPTTSSKWAMGSTRTIQWKEYGTFSQGVKLEYFDGSQWRPITNPNGGTTGAGITGTLVSNNADGSTTKSFNWTLTETNITAGYSNANIRITDANASNPVITPVPVSGNFIIGGIVVNYTPPDRSNTAVAVGATNQTISWTQAGVSNVKLQYHSNTTGLYADIATGTCSGTLTAGAGSCNWTVPNDVSTNTANVKIKAIAVGADGLEASSGIQGSVTDELNNPFIIYGSLSLTSTYNGTSYEVDASTSRVPIAWSGSSSIDNLVFEYTTSRTTPSYVTLLAADLFTTSTGSTTGYNWSSGTGTVWWQPPLTGSTFWVRVRDVGDSAVTSALGGAGDYFSVSGVSITSPTVGTSFNVGDNTITITGNGAGAANVALFYATSLTDAQNKTGSITSIGTTSVLGDDSYSQAWTVPDVINSNVYLRVENAANAAVYKTYGPYTIKGLVTITNPTDTVWVVGETTNTVSGTVKGDIDSLTLQYTTVASPVENDWVNLTGSAVSIGNNSGTGSAAWTAASGSFTVPDLITSSLKLRAIDGTTGRAAALIGKSAAITNSVTIRGALTITTPSALYVGDTSDINWTVQGNIGNVRICYKTSKDDAVADPYQATCLGDATASTASDWTTGLGTVAQNGSYSWTNIFDALAGTGGEGVDPQTDPDHAVYMKLRIESVADPTNVYAETPTGFLVKYRAITWKVTDPGNINTLSGLCATEVATSLSAATPAKAAWTVGTPNNCTDGGFNGASPSNEISATLRNPRYYPDNSSIVGGVNADTYTTTFANKGAQTTYLASQSGWIADSDKIITLTIETDATASLAYEPSINAMYEATNATTGKDAINISSWLTQKGVLVGGTALERADLTAISVNVYDGSGNLLNTTGDLGTGKTVNSQGIFTGIVYNPSAGLDPSAAYTIKSTITYKTKQYTTVSGFVSPTVYNYEAKIGAIYNAANDSVMANIWLERSGATVSDPGNATFRVFGGTSATPLFGPLTILNTDAKNIGGVYTGVEYDPGTTALSSTIIYTIKADIEYRGKTYNAVASFSKGELGTIQSGITAGFATQAATLAALPTSVSNTVTTAVASNLTTQLAGQTTTLQGNITNQTTTLGNQIGTVGTNVTALPTTVSAAVSTDMTTQLAKGIQAELLTRPADVATGATVPIRFRTASGLAPKITVYDPNGTAKVSAAAMKEISTTGIYEYKLTLNTAWGLGDFTVLVSESTKGSTDSLILHVGLGGMDELYSKVTSGTTGSSGVTLDTIFGTVTTVQSNTTGLSSDITSLLTRLGKATDSEGASTVFGKLAAIDASSGNEEAILAGVDEVKNYVDTLEASLGSSADAMSAETIFGRLAEMEDLMKNLGASSKEVEDAKAKANTLAQLMEEIKADLANGNMAEASAKLAALGQGLTSLNSDLSGLPATAGAASVGNAFEDLKNMAAGGGLEALVPLLEEIKASREAFNPENMGNMRNTVEELKSLMTEVRSLLDQEVNKPVVHGWLEEEQE